MRLALATALWILAAVLPGTQVRATPRVLATIKPVHSLVAAIMAGAGTPDLLIQGAQSEHGYALKPSDAARIAHADVVFEIGPDLETYLVAPLASLAPNALVVPLERAPGIRLLAARRGGLWEDHGDGDGPVDPHLWLDPQNAVAMTRAIAAALAKADPAHAGLYRANGRKVASGLAALTGELAASLAPARGRRYVVFHDAYRYFEQRFGLSSVGAVTVAPDRPVGPRRVETLRAAILKGGIDCVFREPQFEPRLVSTLVEGSGARIGVLDPLGAELSPGAALYPTLLRNLAHALTACLGGRDKNR